MPAVPEIAVEQPLGTDLTDGYATIDFGSVFIGSSASPLTFIIRNTGNANLTGLAVSKSGVHNGDYAISAPGATTLAPGANTTFTVTFTPGGIGTRSASLQIASNDVDESPFDINLTGTGNALPVARFTVAGVPAQTIVGTPITGITLTALDASDAVASSFNGSVTFGGTAGITGSSANFVAGVLTGVSITPMTTGSDLTFTVDDGVGHTGAVVFDVLSVYEDWSGGTAMDVDSNGDGVANGLAWVLGAVDPSADAGPLLPTLADGGEPGFVTYTYRRADAAQSASDTSIRVEYGGNLSGWQTAVHDGTDVIINEVNDGYGPGIDKVEVSVRESIAPDGRLFLQLKVGRNPP